MSTQIEALEVRDIIDIACSECGIHLPLLPRMPHDLSDEEIARVCRWVGEKAPGSQIIDGKMQISGEGYGTMIFIAISEFPEFFNRHQLYMVWRN